MLLFLMFSFIIAQAIGAPDFIALLTPLIVYGVTELVKWLLPSLPGWLTISFIVPALAIGVTWVSTLVSDPNMGFWFQVLYGLLAVFVREFFHQIKQRVDENKPISLKS